METEIIINQNIIRLSEEDPLDFYMDSSPMFHEHQKEIKTYSMPLELDFSKYINAAKRGDFKVYTARRDNKIIGYCCYFLNFHIHHASKLFATQDAIFLNYTYRKTGLGEKLLAYTEIRLKELGVNVVHQAHTPWYNWSKTLKESGYKELETIYYKKI